jgi:hypothetical protein
MDILGITIWREARGEGEAGMRAVYQVIVNRAMANRNGWPYLEREQVCLQPYQFSCWNTADPQRALYPKCDGDPQYLLIQTIIGDNNNGQDPTGGATAYYDRSIPAPSWATAESLRCQIGRLRFYKL